ncbi:MAG TPA: flavodoxin domain-containing protein [Acidimicrobiia bacterium]|nr:flavodoxin domain-containing protein [Acidimicrobiia bacterium]
MEVLISVASKHGSTSEIGQSIGSVLQRNGHHVIFLDPEMVDEVHTFEAVVIGSAVYAGHWMKPALQMVERFSEQLQRRSVWIFSSGPIGDPPKPEEDPVDVTGVVASTQARSHRLFAGKLDKAKLGFAERAIVTALHAPYGDFRSWNDIEAWAEEIASALAELPVSGA